MSDEPLFPKQFLWGAATSAYQVEGSPLADGAGPSIWRRFDHTPGRIADGADGDVACDHYRRFAEDVALMRSLGLTAYRFSVAWGRVLPQGTGAVNEKGLDFYRRLVDALLDAGIAPALTLYHWDLPAALDDRGGWLNRDVAQWFADYARVVHRALGDRVALWTTLNEPWVAADAGYLFGVHAPGHRCRDEAPIAAHNLLRAHGAATLALRADGCRNVGLVVNIEPKTPASDREDDVAAARRADAYMNRQYVEPVFLGRYPEEMAEIFGEAWPEHGADDMALIHQPLDHLGLNYYTRAVTRRDDAAWPCRASSVPQTARPRTELGWEVYPQGLEETLLWLHRLGGTPLYVTENGAAFYDPPTAEMGLDDPLRVAYFREHLLATRRAMDRGADVRGYFAWSLLDNLEWAEGRTKRFGLVHVDFATMARTPKASARFYADVIRTRGACLR